MLRRLEKEQPKLQPTWNRPILLKNMKLILEMSESVRVRLLSRVAGRMT